MDRRAAGALLALAACFATTIAAPTATSNHTALDLYDGHTEGCYYNFRHYAEGDRIMTNEPCLNCTCHNRMLMCYLRVCPFTKAIGQDCTVEKRADQCCPIVTCPDVPVDLLTSTSTSSPSEYGATGVGHVDNYGCTVNGRYLPEGAKVPQTPGKPCEHCYCIRNMTTCVMQECTLHVDGCTPIYAKDVCCPIRYFCDHPDEEMPALDDMTTTVRPTPGFLLTTTTTEEPTTLAAKRDCIEGDQLYPDGALIKTEKPCEHCYCMKGDIVCVVQECGTPMENEGKNCTSLPPREGQCCPDTYICEGDELTTETPFEELTTVPPRRGAIEGSGYRHDDEIPYTEGPTFEIEGSGEEEPEKSTEVPEEVTEPGFMETTRIPISYDIEKETSEPDKGLNTVPSDEEITEPTFVEKTTPIEEPKATELPMASSQKDVEPTEPSFTTSQDVIVAKPESSTPSEIEDRTPEQEFTEATTKYDMKPTEPSVSAESETVTSETPEEAITVPGESKVTEPSRVDENIATSTLSSATEEAKVTEIPGLKETKPSKISTDEEIITEPILREGATEPTLTTVHTAFTSVKEETSKPESTEIPSEEQTLVTTKSYESESTGLPIETTEGSGSASTEPTKEEAESSDTAKPYAGEPSSATEKEYVATTEPILQTEDEGTTQIPQTETEQPSRADVTSEYQPSSAETVAPTDSLEVKPTTAREATSSTTESFMELSTFAHVTEKEPFATQSTEKQELPETTTTLNPEENEIGEEIPHLPSPDHIPGEGDCLLNGITYSNNSVVPSTNKCHTGCKCVSSIVKCDPIMCSPPPDYMDSCQVTYDTPDSCCPTYVCDHPKETIPPQPHSQMSGTEIPAIECHGDECEITQETQPPIAPSTETATQIVPEQAEHCSGDQCAIPVPSCSDGNCAEPSQAGEIEKTKPCDGESCESKPADITPQVCANEEECKQVKVPDAVAPCKDGSCVLDNRFCTEEGGCEQPQQQPCEGENCQPSFEESKPQVPVQPCKGDSCPPFASEEPKTEVPVPSCEGESCVVPGVQEATTAAPVPSCEGDACVPVVGGETESATPVPSCEGDACAPAPSCKGDACAPAFGEGIKPESPAPSCEGDNCISETGEEIRPETPAPPCQGDTCTPAPSEETKTKTPAPSCEGEACASSAGEETKLETPAPSSCEGDTCVPFTDGDIKTETPAPSCEGDACGVTESEKLRPETPAPPCKGDACAPVAGEEAKPEIPAPSLCEGIACIPGDGEEIKPESSTPSCGGDSCGITTGEEFKPEEGTSPTTPSKEPKPEEPKVPCEGDSCAPSEETTTEVSVPSCQGDTCAPTASEEPKPEIHVPSCEGESCPPTSDECTDGKCAVQPSQEGEMCSEEDGCKKPEDEGLCHGEECRRREPGSEVSPECTGAECDQTVTFTVKPGIEPEQELETELPETQTEITKTPGEESADQKPTTSIPQMTEPTEKPEAEKSPESSTEGSGMPHEEPETQTEETQPEVSSTETPEKEVSLTEAPQVTEPESQTKLPATEEESHTEPQPQPEEGEIRTELPEVLHSIIPQDDRRTEKPQDEIATETIAPHDETYTQLPEKIFTSTPRDENSTELPEPVVTQEPEGIVKDESRTEIPQVPVTRIAEEVTQTEYTSTSIPEEEKRTEIPEIKPKDEKQPEITEAPVTVGPQEEQGTELPIPSVTSLPQQPESAATTVPEGVIITTIVPTDESPEAILTSRPEDESRTDAPESQVTSLQENVPSISPVEEEVSTEQPESQDTTTPQQSTETEFSKPTTRVPHIETETQTIPSVTSAAQDETRTELPESTVTTGQLEIVTEAVPKSTLSESQETPSSVSLEPELPTEQEETITKTPEVVKETTVAEQEVTTSLPAKEQEEAKPQEELESSTKSEIPQITESETKATKIPEHLTTVSLQPDEKSTEQYPQQPDEIKTSLPPSMQDEYATFVPVAVTGEEQIQTESPLSLVTKQQPDALATQPQTPQQEEVSTTEQVVRIPEEEDLEKTDKPEILVHDIKPSATEKPILREPQPPAFTGEPEQPITKQSYPTDEEATTELPYKPTEAKSDEEQPEKTLSTEVPRITTALSEEPEKTPEQEEHTEPQEPVTQTPVVVEEVTKLPEPEKGVEKLPTEASVPSVESATEAELSQPQTETESPYTKAPEREPQAPEQITTERQVPEEVATRIPEAEGTSVETKVPEISTELPVLPESEVTYKPTEQSETYTTEQGGVITTTPKDYETKYEEPQTDIPVALVPQEEETASKEPEPAAPEIQPTEFIAAEEITTVLPILEVTEKEQEVPEEPVRTPSPEQEVSETTPYLVELEEHTHKIYEEPSSAAPVEEPTTTRAEPHEAGYSPEVTESPTELPSAELTEAPEKIPETPSVVQEELTPVEPTKVPPEEIPEQTTGATSLSDKFGEEEVQPLTTKLPEESEQQFTPVVPTETEKPFVASDESEKETPVKPIEPELETSAPEEEFIPTTAKATTIREMLTTQAPLFDKFTKPSEAPMPGQEMPSELQPTDEVPSPEDESHFPSSGGYGQEPDYGEEDQAFGPGTCRYGGKVYVSAQQIPRDDPCDFCFCFRSDIICLQQSCPPPIHGCHEEPIQGFCCPRYECPVAMATTLNVTTTTTTTTTTLPPHFLPHAYKGAAQRRGCQIKGHTYKVGEVVRASSGPCLHCTCGGDGQMKCDPKACTPEPMLRQMIAAAVSAKRRR